MDFPTWPFFDKDDQAAVTSVLASGQVNYWTSTTCQSFEAAFAKTMGAQYGVSVANGTLALELALRSVGVGPGDEVILPARSFVATASAVLMCGATPVFVDVDLASQNITVDTIQPAITSRTKAIIVVHLAGWACDMAPIQALAAHHQLWLIEDCAQAHGAANGDKKVGAFGDLAAFSFCQDKIMTTGGEGGMVLTSEPTLYQKVWQFKDHGKNPQKIFNQGENLGSFRYVHDSLGSNYRMTAMQGAIGLTQLAKLPAWLATRRKHAMLYHDCLKTIPALEMHMPHDPRQHAYYKFYCLIKPEQLKKGWDRNKILATLRAMGIPIFSGICPEIYLEEVFTAKGLGLTHRLPNAKQLGERSLMLLTHPTLQSNHILHITNTIKKVMTQASISSCHDAKKNKKNETHTIHQKEHHISS